MSKAAKETSSIKFEGTYYLKHYREGELIGEEESSNIIVDEGLAYCMNATLAIPVGSAPSPINNFYIGLATSARVWLSSDTAANVSSLAAEFITYDETARPTWTPQVLASIGNIQLDNIGAEATYTIGNLGGSSITLTGGFLVSASPKDASQDASATLISGSQFVSSRVLYELDVLKIGYTLTASGA